MCIVESWLSQDIADSELFIPNYSIIRLDRNRHGGGVLIYFLTTLTANTLYKGSADLELLIVSLKLSTFVIVIALMYRPPGVTDIIFDELFSVLCSHVNVSLFNNFVLIGDFNVNLLSPCNALCHKLLSVTNSFSLSQVVTEPTRISNSSTLIDLIFLSSPSQLSSCRTVPPLASSDHLGLHLSVTADANTHRTRLSRRKLWKYDQADFDLAAEMINNTDWDSLLSDNIHSSWKNWHTRFMEIMHSCIPQVTAKPKKSLPWLNKRILQTISKRNACFRLYKST